MEGIQQEITGGKTGFFKTFFTLTKEEKAESLNFLQYTILALIPLIILVRVNQVIWPKADEKKGTIEILAEVLGQVIFTGVIVFIVYRIIDFIPTYSGIPLKGINMLSIITIFILTLPWYDSTSNLGAKMQVLHKRIDAKLPSFFGIQPDKTQKTGSNNGNSNNGGGSLQVAQPTHISSRADYLGAHGRLAATGGQPAQKPSYPSFDNMYQQNPPNTQGSNNSAAAAPTENFASFEPMAANASLGGSFGSAF